MHSKWDSWNVFALWCKVTTLRSITFAGMFLMTNAPKVTCVLQGFAMNMALSALKLGCNNCWEIRGMLTINNPYLWTMSTGKFRSALNWWIASTVYQFVVWANKNALSWYISWSQNTIFLYAIMGSLSLFIFLGCVCISTLLYLCTFLVDVFARLYYCPKRRGFFLYE